MKKITNSMYLAFALIVIAFACFALSLTSTVAGHPAGVHKEIILSDSNRMTVENYAAATNKPVVDVLIPVCDFLSSKSKSNADFKRTLVRFLDGVQSDSLRKKIPVQQAWKDLWQQVSHDPQVLFSMTFGGGGMTSFGTKPKKCPGDCKVYYKCFGTSCMLCASNCDTSCSEKCGSSTGCDPKCGVTAPR